MKHSKGVSSDGEEREWERRSQQMSSPEISDEMLIHAIADGAEWAFEPLYQRYSRRLYSLAYRMVSSQQIAEDLLQEAFVLIWRRASTYSLQQGPVRNWIMTIMHNRTIDYLRSVQRHTSQMKEASWEDVEREEPLADTDTSEEALQAIQNENLHDALKKLPPDQRDAIELSYFQGWSQSEIADGRHIPLGTVKARMRLGLKKLGRIFTDMGIDER